MEMQPGVERVLVPVHGHVVAADVHLLDDPRPPVVFLHGILTTVAVAPQLFADPEAESWIALSLPGHHPGCLAAGSHARRFHSKHRSWPLLLLLLLQLLLLLLLLLLLRLRLPRLRLLMQRRRQQRLLVRRLGTGLRVLVRWRRVGRGRR